MTPSPLDRQVREAPVDHTGYDSPGNAAGWEVRSPASPRIAALYCYPVKGCASVASNTAVLTHAGIMHDRSFMVVTENGVYRTQRRDPMLATIQPGISDDGSHLTLSSPATGSVEIAIDTTSPPRPVDLFGTAYTGIDQGPQAAEWLSATLGSPSRLVRVAPNHRRVTNGRTAGTAGYADSSAVHILSEATLAALNERLVATRSPALPMSRFRPNIVLTGCEQPHIEDTLRQVRLGPAALAYAKLTLRCVVTTVDQDTGRKSGPEPLRTLASYRRASGGGVAFGSYFAVTAPGRIAVGDPVLADESAASDL
jgi:uncharacterized protein YcbX